MRTRKGTERKDEVLPHDTQQRPSSYLDKSQLPFSHVKNLKKINEHSLGQSASDCFKDTRNESSARNNEQ